METDFVSDNGGPVVCLCSINVRVQPGALVAVVGQVGHGKSSLVSAMLGEMCRLHGSVCIKVLCNVATML